MTEEAEPTADGQHPAVYEIRIQGHLGPEWADWFEGMTLTLEGSGETVLTGRVADQSALFGLLKKVRDLGMPLLIVQRLSARKEEPRGVEKSDPSS